MIYHLCHNSNHHHHDQFANLCSTICMLYITIIMSLSDFVQTEHCCFESYSATSGSRFTVHCCLFIQISALQLEIQIVKIQTSQNTNAFFHKLEVKLILRRKRCVQLEDGFGSQGNESFLRKAGCDYHISKHFTYIIGDNHISILLEYFLYQIVKCV